MYRFCSQALGASVLVLAASVAYLGAGCSFDTTAGEGNCAEPGTERGGFVCTADGWRRSGSVDTASFGRDDGMADSADGGETGVDPTDAGSEDDAEAPGDDVEDGGSETDGEADGEGCSPETETCRCDYAGTSRGVCSQGQLGSSGEECLAPEDYVEEESGDRCDGLDNDCDGTVDEGCECDAGATQSCYTGSPETRGVGACEAGMQTCDGGTWGDCTGEMLPTDDEVCGNSRDDDCDGAVDENCPCDYLGTSTGVCGEARSGDDGECRAPEDFMESTEDERPNCDGLDNDCDGVVDEGCVCEAGEERSCYSGPSQTEGVGICEPGTETCGQDNTWGDCQGETTPESEEICGNDADDDCDGNVDEGCRCDYDGKSEGVCEDQPLTSSGCKEPTEYESTESSCGDQLDNDCDGDVDGDDADCNRRAGESCSANDQCLAGRCEGGTCVHRIFVTSTGWEGDMGGLSGADSNCASVASSADLGGEWRAVVSDENTAAKDRLRVAAPVYNLGGQELAGGKPDLWDRSIDNPVNFDESGRRLSTYVWTSTNSDGTKDGANEPGSGQQCDNWKSDAFSVTGELGLSSSSDRSWLIIGDNSRCSEVRALYCIDGQNP